MLLLGPGRIGSLGSLPGLPFRGRKDLERTERRARSEGMVVNGSDKGPVIRWRHCNHPADTEDIVWKMKMSKPMDYLRRRGSRSCKLGELEVDLLLW